MSNSITSRGAARRDMMVDAVKAVTLASLLVAASLLLQCNVGINLADEGFLWYGAEQTLVGKVPLRDFQSYDPGRYYWCAFWMKIFGNGIISLRLSAAVFQVIGLTLGLLAVKQSIRSWKVTVVAGLVLLVWMIPRWKSFDCSLSMIGIFLALRLIEDPSPRRHFISGMFIGLAAFFGRNHGLYNCLAFAMLVLFIRFRLERKDLLRSGLSMGSGVLLGFTPMVLMMVAVPGFLDSFLAPFRLMASARSTNLTIPIPWPWTFDYSGMDFSRAAEVFSTGSFFVILPLVYALGIISALICRRDNLKKKLPMAVSSLVGVVYMHHAFARAEIQHLAESVAPLLITIFALPHAFGFDRRRIRCGAGLALLLLMTFYTAGRFSPLYKKVTSGPMGYWRCDIDGDSLWLPRDQVNQIRAIRETNSRLVSPEEGLLIAPWYPGMYPILKRESPIWDIYLLWPQTEARQIEIIDELEEKNVNWAIVHDMPLDGMEERRLSRTYKILWAYLIENYEAHYANDPSVSHVVLHKRTEKPSRIGPGRQDAPYNESSGRPE